MAMFVPVLEFVFVHSCLCSSLQSHAANPHATAITSCTLVHTMVHNKYEWLFVRSISYSVVSVVCNLAHIIHSDVILMDGGARNELVESKHYIIEFTRLSD